MRAPASEWWPLALTALSRREVKPSSNVPIRSALSKVVWVNELLQLDIGWREALRAHRAVTWDVSRVLNGMIAAATAADCIARRPSKYVPSILAAFSHTQPQGSSLLRKVQPW